MAQSRNEAILENMLGADNELTTPQSRNEKLLLKLLGENVTIETPQSRVETLLTEMIDKGFTAFTDDDVGKVVAKEGDKYVLEASSGGGGSVTTGTITFDEEFTLDNRYTVTHNLGKAPSGVAWMITNSTSVNSSGVYWGGYKISSEYVTPTQYAGTSYKVSTVNGTLQLSIKSGEDASTLWGQLAATDTQITLFAFYDGKTPYLKILAGTTIRWFVW